MTLHMKRAITWCASLALLSMTMLPTLASAQTAPTPPLTTNDLGVNAVAQSGLVLQGGDVRQTAARIINVALGFLGIIAVVIVLVGGFKYMLSGGSEEKTAEARNLIFSGIIGLAIILSAWAITSFVITSLISATSTPTS